MGPIARELGYNGHTSKNATARGAHHGRQRVRCDNAELYVGHVIDSTALEAAGTYPVDLIPALEKEFRDSIAGQVAKAEAEPQIKKVEVVVRAGRIRETLKDDMLDVIKPDLVVCGARGLSSIKYAILGSISTFLTRNTECDTLIVK